MIEIEKLYEVYKQHPVISTDSRNIIPGSIFFALKGPAFNGNAFAEQAMGKGAAYAVIDEKNYQKNDKCLLTDDVLSTLQVLANHHRHQMKIPFIAITGSNGKTTTKELIRSVLSKKFRTLATKGNLNNHIGVPLTILSITSDIEIAVIEMGANHQKEIESYCLIAEPDFGLITNVGKAHLEGFGGFEGVKKGKGELYEWISKSGKGIFINGDSDHLNDIRKKYKIREAVTYGTNEDYYCIGKISGEEPLSVKWKCGNADGEVESHLTGTYNFENILSAVCIGNYFGVNSVDINNAIAGYVPDNSRSQVVKKGTNTIILDAYNANPTSTEAALTNFAKISGDHKIVFIGDMAELGDESAEEHKHIISLIIRNKFDKVILVGKNFGQFSGEINSINFGDSDLAAEWVKKNPLKNSSILIKGSRSTKMEKILEAL